jgi:hypothetical protein
VNLGIAFAVVATGAQPACSLPPGWSTVTAGHPHFIVFGEEHGTRESPELVGSIACALAMKGERILVAVELPSRTNLQLQRLWQTPIKGFSDRILADLPGFSEREDGVGSRAMLAMLERLHFLSSSGKNIDVVAFDRARDPAQSDRWRMLPGQGPREAEQAENIATAASAKPYDQVHVLTGNGHAQKRLHEDGSGVSFEPMAMRLARSGPLVSLEQTFGTGTAWNCIAGRCGLHGKIGAVPTGAMHVGLWSAKKSGWDSGYDGYFWIPVVNGSPPAGKAQAE